MCLMRYVYVILVQSDTSSNGWGVKLEKRRGEPESGKSRFYGVVMKVIPAHIVSYAIY
jgi:hypothetical protein